MRKDKYKAPQGSDSEFVDEILAEARKMRGDAAEELDDKDIPLAQARPVGDIYKQGRKTAEPLHRPEPAVNPPAPEMGPQTDSGAADEENGAKKKKKRFGRRHRQEVTAGEDDIYF